MRILLFLLLPTSLFAQDFPESWEGTYEGNMILGFANRPNDTVPVVFEMLPVIADSVWTYKTTFNSERYGVIVKDYQIIRKTKENDQDFLLDEQNGIQMDMIFMNGALYGMYEVMGQMFIVTGRMTGEQLFIELFAAPMNNPLITGTEDDPETEEMDAIEAKSYQPFLHQTVLLTRKQ